MDLTRGLYMNPGTDPTIDRPKPRHAQSALFQWDNACSALDAEWECLPYAYAQCADTYGTDAHIECVDDHFHACRRGAGCDYRYVLTPSICSANAPVHELVTLVCDDPSKAYASKRSYNACVDRMKEWTASGCGNVEELLIK